MLYLDRDAVSELHKDAYGIYPTSWWWQCWNEASDELKLEEWNDLIETIKHNQNMKNGEEK